MEVRFDRNEGTVLLNALDRLQEDLPSDDEDQGVILALKERVYTAMDWRV